MHCDWCEQVAPCRLVVFESHEGMETKFYCGICLGKLRKFLQEIGVKEAEI